MKVVCICDAGVPEMLMQYMKKLPGCDVTLYTEKTLTDIKSLTTCERTAELRGAEACPVSAEMLEAVREAEILVTHVAPVNRAVLDAAPNVKIVGVLRQSDFVTIHMRHEAGQSALIGADELAMMKKNAILVNCARAGLVDTAALVEALRAHRIGGAAIDVFDEEPLSPDSPLLTLDNVTLTPHIAGTTVDAFANSVEIMLRQLSLLLAGKDAPNRVV